MSPDAKFDCRFVTFAQFATAADAAGFKLDRLLDLDFGNDRGEMHGSTKDWDAQSGRDYRRDFVKRLKQREFADNPIPYRCLLKLYVLWTKPATYYELFPDERQEHEETPARACQACGAAMMLGRADRRYCDASCRKQAQRGPRSWQGSGKVTDPPFAEHNTA